MKETHGKIIWSRSDGKEAIHLHGTKQIIMFRSDRCRMMKGIEGYLSSWLGNVLRTYAPMKYHIYDQVISIEFPLEGVEFVADKINELPEGLEQYELCEKQNGR